MKTLVITIIVSLTLALLPESFASNKKEQKDYVKVVYFHSKNRCYTCNLIESFTKEAVETIFEDKIKEGKVKLEVINFDEKSNKHFVKKYNLYNQTLIMVRYEKGKEKVYKNCEMIWVNVRDKVKFFDYIESEVNSYLKDI